MGGNISVDLSMFVLLYNTNFLNKLQFNDLKNPKNLLAITKILNLQNHPTFQSEERLVELRKRKRVLCWSISIISLWWSLTWVMRQSPPHLVYLAPLLPSSPASPPAGRKLPDSDHNINAGVKIVS